MIRLFILGALFMVAGWATNANAQTTFSNTNAITINDSTSATPYPSQISVLGMPGTTTKAVVKLIGFNHTWPGDVTVLLVSPTGLTVNLMNQTGGGTDAVGVDLTFDDAGVTLVPSVTGTYKPVGGNPTYLAPAPAGPYGQTMAAVNGASPNGNWNLYVQDNAGGDVGNFAGGWSLTLTSSADPTSTTTLASSANPSAPGANVTFTSTTLRNGNPATQGSVKFYNEGVQIGGPVNVNGSGTAAFTTNALPGGINHVTAVYSGQTGYAQGSTSAALTQVVQTARNSAAITINDNTAAAPYPSTLSVSGLSGSIGTITVSLHGLNHTFPGDLEVLLVGPGGQTIQLMNRDGGGNDAVGTDLTFDDNGASPIVPDVSGRYKPSGGVEVTPYAAPAPAGPYGQTMSAAQFTSPNGTWSLYVQDCAALDTGTIDGGWSLAITTTSAAATSTALAASPNPSNPNQNVNFTATVTTSGNPVTQGTVTFKEGATTLAGPTAVNGSGQASFSTSALASGSHVITATYNGVNGVYGTSSGSVTQVVNTPTLTLVSSKNPSALAEDVTFTATCMLGANPLTTGTVTFYDGANVFSGPTTVNGSGVATAHTTSLTEGTHQIRALYSGTGTAEMTIAQSVGSQVCNTAPITINDADVATPYPSTITVVGQTGTISHLSVKLMGLTHTFPGDIAALLVGPHGETCQLLNRNGGGNSVDGIDLTFDDTGDPLPDALITGTYQPAGDTGIDFAAPAPAAPYGGVLAPFNNTSPNGTWSLYIEDRAFLDSGMLNGGWCLSFQSGGGGGGTHFVPNSVIVTQGGYFSGNLASLANSDDVRYRFFDDTDSLVGEIEVTGLSPLGNAISTYSVAVEARATRAGLQETISAYNYDVSSFDELTADEALLTDTVMTGTVTGFASDYVSGVNDTAKVRVNFQPFNDEVPIQDGWLLDVDKIEWTVNP